MPDPVKKNLKQLQADREALKIELTAAQDSGDTNAEADAREKLDTLTDTILEFASTDQGDPLAMRKMQDDMAAMQKRLTASDEAAKKSEIDRKVASVPFPALREHFRVLYDVAMSDVATKQSFSFEINGEKAEVEPAKVIDDLIERLGVVGNRMTHEFAVAGDDNGDLTTAVDRAANPGDEVDRLTQAYILQNKLGETPADYEQASQAVLSENPELAARYAANIN